MTDDRLEGKPYRVYRGGRRQGGVPLERKADGAGVPPRKGGSGEPPPYRGPGARPDRARARPRRRRGPNLKSFGFWWRAIGLAVLAFVLLVFGWGLASYFEIRDGVKQANKRLPRGAKTQLEKQGGLLLFHSTTVMLIGTDHSPTEQRSGSYNSDSLLLLRTDPDKHRLAYLSIPRDLRVEIPGHGYGKVNAAYPLGGAALALRTVRQFTDEPIHHVVIIDFRRFRTLIDALGGIDVNVPAPILSNRFDCPYSKERCATWKGWRFEKGWQHMNGWRALIYSRIRTNQLDPTESDFSRVERQQQVLRATLAKATSVSTVFRLPFSGAQFFAPLTTDLSTGQFMQLGWVMKRAAGGKELHCRLGGTASDIGGQSVILPTEENFAVIRMFRGDSAPQPPIPGSGLYGPGCVVGNETFRRT